MSYYTGLTYAPFTDDLVMPVAAGAAQRVTGIPQGYWVCGALVAVGWVDGELIRTGLQTLFIT